MRVMDLMSRSPVTCKTTDTLNAAAKLMWDCDCGAIPVVGEGVSVKGMITDRDICMACFTQDKPPSSILVAEAMSDGLFFCSPDGSVADAERIMRRNQVRRLPVMDRRGDLVGILSLADIAREAERERIQGKRDIAPEELTDVLGEICQPWQVVLTRTH